MAIDIKTALRRLLSRESGPPHSDFAYPQAVRQLNGLLQAAKLQHPDRHDVLALEDHFPTTTRKGEFLDTANRLQDALDLEPDVPLDAPLMHQKFGILRAEAQLVADFDTALDDQAGIGLLFLDIDHFKALNTRYTETVVDSEILVPFQRWLADGVRQRGYCYSVGGDEFIILLRNSSPPETRAFAERLLLTAQDAEFNCAGDPLGVTLSIGTASCPADGRTVQEIREKANYAENKAKEGGRNRVLSYAVTGDSGLAPG